MQQNFLIQKDTKAYLLLTGLAICGLTSSVITATKVVNMGINFPFSTLVFSIFTYPIVDCICELWGKQAARQTIWISLFCQLIFTLLIQLSIVTPHAAFWQLQDEYNLILNTNGTVVMASLLAFTVSQIMDIFVYQKVKDMCQGKKLWLRSNLSTYIGQVIDSTIFVMIVFHSSSHKFTILFGAIVIKIIISFLMTPIVYLIVMTTNRYLDFKTLAFKGDIKSPVLQ